MAKKRTSKAELLPWLSIVEDVFPVWRDRRGSSEDARVDLYALLRDRDTRSAKRRVDANGKEIPGTFRFLDADFWLDPLSLEPDPDCGDDRLAVDYSDHEDIYWDHYSPGWRWEFLVWRTDVERWDRRHATTAAASSKKRRKAKQPSRANRPAAAPPPPPPSPPPPPPPPEPKATVGAEGRAIAHLKLILDRRRDAMSKDDAWEECKQFIVSYNGF